MSAEEEFIPHIVVADDEVRHVVIKALLQFADSRCAKVLTDDDVPEFVREQGIVVDLLGDLLDGDSKATVEEYADAILGAVEDDDYRAAVEQWMGETPDQDPDA